MTTYIQTQSQQPFKFYEVKQMWGRKKEKKASAQMKWANLFIHVISLVVEL